MFYFEYPTVDTTLYEGTVSSSINTGLDEILEVDNSIKKLIFNGADQTEIKKNALKNGMTPLRDAGIEKIINGVTSIEEVKRATVEDI